MSNPHIKAVIFDMDGVLIDSQPLHYRADIDTIKKAGFPATMETVAPFTGISNPDRWPKYRETLNLPVSAETLTEWQTQFIMDAFREAFDTKSLTAIPGIPELLAYIKNKGIKTALASSSSPALIELVLQRLNLSPYFDVVVSGEDVAIGKPAPDVFLFAAKQLDTAPEQCAVIEDSANGVKAAKNANMLCIAYRNPTTEKQDLSPADFVVDSYADCYKWLSCIQHR